MAAPWLEGHATKAFRAGAHRVLPPEATLARAAPFAAAAGITRVGVLTGLDRIGIPVAAAYRPNSRTVSVHQGKGVTLAAAKASALMEAIETFHAETMDLQLRLAQFADLAPGTALDPAGLPRTGPGDLRHRKLLWVEGRRLADGAPVWVPRELVGIDLAQDAPTDGVFQATTNGLASGNDVQEALIHALCEAVERDAVTLWQALPPALQDERAVDLGSFATGAAEPDMEGASVAAEWLGRIAAAGLAARVWDVTSDIALPVFACLIAGRDGVQPELGFGCHTDRGVALLRAIGEAAQARLTVISGARDDLAGDFYGTGPGRGPAEAWLAAPACRDYRAAPHRAHDNLSADLRAVLAALAQAGVVGAAWVDLTRQDIGLPVVRVVVPGLEGPWAPPGGPYWPGARARRRSP